MLLLHTREAVIQRRDCISSCTDCKANSEHDSMAEEHASTMAAWCKANKSTKQQASITLVARVSIIIHVQFWARQGGIRHTLGNSMLQDMPHDDSNKDTAQCQKLELSHTYTRCNHSCVYIQVCACKHMYVYTCVRVGMITPMCAFTRGHDNAYVCTFAWARAYVCIDSWNDGAYVCIYGCSWSRLCAYTRGHEHKSQEQHTHKTLGMCCLPEVAPATGAAASQSKIVKHQVIKAGTWW